MTGAGEGNRTPDLRFTKPFPPRSPCLEPIIFNRIEYASFGPYRPTRARICTRKCTPKTNGLSITVPPPFWRVRSGAVDCSCRPHLQTLHGSTGSHPFIREQRETGEQQLAFHPRSFVRCGIPLRRMARDRIRTPDPLVAKRRTNFTRSCQNRRQTRGISRLRKTAAKQFYRGLHHR